MKTNNRIILIKIIKSRVFFQEIPFKEKKSLLED